MESMRPRRIMGSLAAAVVAGLFAAAPAPDAKAAEQKSTRNEAEWVEYDAAAKTVTLKIKKAGLGPGAAMLKVGQQVVFNVKPEGSVLTRTSVAVNGKKGELTDIPPGKTVLVYWVPDATGRQGALRAQDRRDPERAGARREVRQGGVGRGAGSIAKGRGRLPPLRARSGSACARRRASRGIPSWPWTWSSSRRCSRGASRALRSSPRVPATSIHGMTVSAFTEVSLVPPLVLVCADKTSNTHPVIARGGVFALNVLAHDQAALSDRFASKRDEERRFEGLDYETGVTGAPLLAGTVATLDCRVRAAHDAGDHVIYVGEVVDLRRSDREPLVYWSAATAGSRPARVEPRSLGRLLHRLACSCRCGRRRCSARGGARPSAPAATFSGLPPQLLRVGAWSARP